LTYRKLKVDHMRCCLTTLHHGVPDESAGACHRLIKCYFSILLLEVNCCYFLWTPTRLYTRQSSYEIWSLSCPAMQHGQQLNVIPYPAIVEYVGPEVFRLPVNPGISFCAVLQSQAEYLQHGLQQRFSTPANVQQRAENTVDTTQAPINLRLVDDLPALWDFRWSQEGYELVCNTDGITITALSSTGVFYGIQTLLQALSVADEQQGLCMPHTRVSVVRPRVVENRSNRSYPSRLAYPLRQGFVWGSASEPSSVNGSHLHSNCCSKAATTLPACC